MKRLTLDELKDALRAAAGEDEPGALDEDILDKEFADLGYDSLAVMEMTSLVQRRLGVKLPEEEVVEVHTPREFLSFANGKLVAT
ncbi:MAG: actinorhodin polyketide synthase [Mycobacterium sp.]|jgi:act minimal PKS acyl carrier protein|nr:actinorhodin polyketide synthase [Mycobacterium sp.]